MAKTLDAWHADTATDVVRLLTSELVTNTIVHANSDVDVYVHLKGDRVRVEVEDHNREVPAPKAVRPDALHGRGLQIVAGMAAAWGVSRRSDGKVVWFEVPAEQQLVDHHGIHAAEFTRQQFPVGRRREPRRSPRAGRP